MKLKAAIGLLLVVFILAACNGKNVNEESSINEKNPADIKKLVQDYSASKMNDNQTASITSQQLIVTDSNNDKTVYALPKDEFFVSIAPYVNETHPCKDHSLTGCQGEMVDKEFDVFIEDANGNTVLDKTLKSQSNGFIDLWLPRDQKYRITIEQDGKKVESEFSTYEEDGTCITTMQLT